MKGAGSYLLALLETCRVTMWRMSAEAEALPQFPASQISCKNLYSLCFLHIHVNMPAGTIGQGKEVFFISSIHAGDQKHLAACESLKARKTAQWLVTTRISFSTRSLNPSVGTDVVQLSLLCGSPKRESRRQPRNLGCVRA